jgi:hypothetical protein
MSRPEKTRPDNIPDMTLPERTTPPGLGRLLQMPAPANDGPNPAISKTPAPWETPTAVGAWKVGDRVLAPWEPMFFYVGIIQEINKNRVLIQFDDGDAGWVTVDQLRPLLVEPGQKVSSRRNMGPLFYPAEIFQVRGDEVLVGFGDGTDEWTRIAALRFFREEDDESEGAQPTKVASKQVFLYGLRNGHRVWTPWSAGILFVGTVHDIRDDEAHIHFDDGNQGWVQLAQLLPFEPTVGMRVIANWRRAGQYYPGVVTQINGDRLHIHYDDGDQEWTNAAALALPSADGGPDARPTKTVSARASTTGIPSWAITAIIVVALLFLRLGCRAFFSQ